MDVPWIFLPNQRRAFIALKLVPIGEAYFLIQDASSIPQTPQQSHFVRRLWMMMMMMIIIIIIIMITIIINKSVQPIKNMIYIRSCDDAFIKVLSLHISINPPFPRTPHVPSTHCRPRAVPVFSLLRRREPSLLAPKTAAVPIAR